MGVVRKDLFGDGEVSYEYNPGQNVVLRVSGFKVVLWKPYTVRPYVNGKEVYVNPIIEMSTNSTVLLDINELKLIEKAIKKAAEILNREGTGLIDIKKWASNSPKENARTCELEIDPYMEIKNKVPAPPKPQKIKKGDLFRDSRNTQNMFIYLGKGEVYKSGLNGGMEHYNRHGCPLVFLRVYENDLKNIGKHGYNLRAMGVDAFQLDTYATEKKAYEIIQNYGNIQSVIFNGTIVRLRTE